MQDILRINFENTKQYYQHMMTVYLSVICGKLTGLWPRAKRWDESRYLLTQCSKASFVSEPTPHTTTHTTTIREYSSLPQCAFYIRILLYTRTLYPVHTKNVLSHRSPFFDPWINKPTPLPTTRGSSLALLHRPYYFTQHHTCHSFNRCCCFLPRSVEQSFPGVLSLPAVP